MDYAQRVDILNRLTHINACRYNSSHIKGATLRNMLPQVVLTQLKRHPRHTNCGRKIQIIVVEVPRNSRVLHCLQQPDFVGEPIDTGPVLLPKELYGTGLVFKFPFGNDRAFKNNPIAATVDNMAETEDQPGSPMHILREVESS
jgi:hypothetical protein